MLRHGGVNAVAGVVGWVGEADLGGNSSSIHGNFDSTSPAIPSSAILEGDSASITRADNPARWTARCWGRPETAEVVEIVTGRGTCSRHPVTLDTPSRPEGQCGV